jgi:hypothetical protein
MGQVDIKGDKARFKKYPDQGAFVTKRKKVAGIEGKMVGEREGGPWQEDDVACGCGQATERMGSVKGPADFKPKKEVFGNSMKKIR